RNVVIAGYGQHRTLQMLYEIAGRRELGAPGALRDVAPQQHQFGLHLPRQREQCADGRGVFAAEMGIGNVQQPRHADSARSASGGTSRRSGWGETRKCNGVSSQQISPSSATLTRRLRPRTRTVSLSKPKLKTWSASPSRLNNPRKSSPYKARVPAGLAPMATSRPCES